MARTEDWDTPSFANHSQYYNDQSTALFSQMHDVETRFRDLRAHLSGNIPQDIKGHEQEMEDRIEKIRRLQNEIFETQFQQFSVHEFKGKTQDNNDEDPFEMGIGKKRKGNKDSNGSDAVKKESDDKESKVEDIDDTKTEEKVQDKEKEKVERQYSMNPFEDLDEDDGIEEDEDRNGHFKGDQYGKYQDILDSFGIEEMTTKKLLKKLKNTTTKMKELNELAMGKNRQHP